MIGDNAKVSTQRKGTFNANTKQTAGYSAHLSNVSCFIYDPSKAQRAQGFAVEYDLVLTCEVGIDIVDLDLVSGWNPGNLSPVPVYIVNHVSIDSGGLGAHRTCYLRAFRG